MSSTREMSERMKSGTSPKSDGAVQEIKQDVKKNPLKLSFILLDKGSEASRPTKIIAREDLKIGDAYTAKKFYHAIKRCAQITDSEIVNFFLKENKDNAHMSEVEAANANFCRVLAPYHVPPAYAVYDQGGEKKGIFTAVISEEIPGFKSIGDDPLEEKDIQIDFFAKPKKDCKEIPIDYSTKYEKASIEELEKLDEEFRKLDMELKRVERVTQKIDKDKLELRTQLAAWRAPRLDGKGKSEHKAEFKSVPQTPTALSTPTVLQTPTALSTPTALPTPTALLSLTPIAQPKKEDLLAEYKKISARDDEIFAAKIEAEENLKRFYIDLERKPGLTPKEFENYRIIKGLAIAITTSYIQMEDDLHQNNISKFGWRIDHDMSLWPLSYKFKPEGYVESVLYSRKPQVDQFKATPTDIVNLPELKDANPYYWPLKPSRGVRDATRATMSAVGQPLSINEFPARENSIFQKLKDNPIFIYHKYATLTKFILTNEEIYRNIAKLHMRQDIPFGSESLIDAMANMQASRIKEFRTVLLDMSEFIKFFKNNSERLAEELVKDLSSQKLNFDKEKIHTAQQEIMKHIAKKSETVSIDILVNVKKLVKEKMNEYLNPGLFALGGYLRNHAGSASSIVEMCDATNPDPVKSDKINAAIRDLARVVGTVYARTPRDGKEFDKSITAANNALTEVVAKLPPLTPAQVAPSTPDAVVASPITARNVLG